MKKSIDNLWNYRELLIAFTFREIKIRYKQTILGASWAILQPAALTIIFSLVFGLFLKVNSGSVPYPVFSYSALLPWTFFTTAISFGALSVVNNGNLVTKVYFPREILPLSAVGAAFIDFLSASVIFLVMFFVYKISFSAAFFYILLIFPSILLLSMGISFILSALNVMFRDIRFVVPLVLQIWLYISPVIYSMDQVPEKFRKFYILNPMAPLIQSFRDVTVFGKNPNIGELTLAIIISFLIFVIGYLFFKAKERKFADII